MPWEGQKPCSELAAPAGTLLLGAQAAAGAGPGGREQLGGTCTGSAWCLYTEQEHSHSLAEQQSCFLFALLFTACHLIS